MNHHTFRTKLYIGHDAIDVEVTVSVEASEPATRDYPGVQGGPDEVIGVKAGFTDLTHLIGDETQKSLLEDAVASLQSAASEARYERAEAIRDARMGG